MCDTQAIRYGTLVHTTETGWFWPRGRRQPGPRVATHSLRRGGASAYSCHISDEAIQRFGRWTSSGYTKYVWPHAEMFAAGGRLAATYVPRFERN